MIKPTRRAVIVFAAGLLPALLIVVAFPEQWAAIVYYGMFVFVAMAADALRGFPKRALTLDIKVPKRIYIGEKDKMTVALKLARYSRQVAFDVFVEQRGALESVPITAYVVKPSEPTELVLPIVPTRRGQAHIDRLWFRWQGPWRLVEFTHIIKVAETIDVVPNARGARNEILRYLSMDSVIGEKAQDKGEGAEYEALREYVPGHDIRFIDWKSSAKHRKLLCKEFRAERNHHVILAFDTGHLMQEPLSGIPRLDHFINAALPLAWVGLHSGDLVGTYGFDAAVRHYQQPLRGRAAFNRIQRATAQLDYHHEETNFTLGLAELTARLNRRALVVIFTEFVDTITSELLVESMQRISKRHAIIFVTLKDPYLQKTIDTYPNSYGDVTRAAIAQDFLDERAVVLERLNRMGIHCLDVPNKGLSMRLINRYLQIKQRGQI